MKPEKRIIAAAALACAAVLSAQQEGELVRSYIRNFIRSSLAIKIDVLKEAGRYEKAGMGPLFHMGVRFTLENAQYLQSDVQLRDVAAISVQGIRREGYVEALPDLWSLFQIFKEPYVRIPIIEAMGDLAAGNSQAVLNLNTFLYNQNSVRQAGVDPDFQQLEACVRALGRLGSATSYSVLFDTYAAGYSDSITRAALDAMAALQGDYKGYLIEVIRKNSSIERMAALKAAMENSGFSEAEKAEVAESALDMSLSYVSTNSVDMQIIRDIRARSIRELTQRNWSRASALAIRAFNLASSEYGRGIGTKAALLESIALLGAVRTSEAAQTLTLQLQLLNAERDAGAKPDEDFVLAVIRNLGDLGDMVAFDHLLFVSYLDYPESIKSAAREALKKLRL
jgi:hypothetical protein